MKQHPFARQLLMKDPAAAEHGGDSAHINSCTISFIFYLNHLIFHQRKPTCLLVRTTVGSTGVCAALFLENIPSDGLSPDWTAGVIPRYSAKGLRHKALQTRGVRGRFLSSEERAAVPNLLTETSVCAETKGHLILIRHKV